MQISGLKAIRRRALTNLTKLLIFVLCLFPCPNNDSVKQVTYKSTFNQFHILSRVRNINFEKEEKIHLKQKII